MRGLTNETVLCWILGTIGAVALFGTCVWFHNKTSSAAAPFPYRMISCNSTMVDVTYNGNEGLSRAKTFAMALNQISKEHKISAIVPINSGGGTTTDLIVVLDSTPPSTATQPESQPNK